jgi:hypothetical protein
MGISNNAPNKQMSRNLILGSTIDEDYCFVRGTHKDARIKHHFSMTKMGLNNKINVYHIEMRELKKKPKFLVNAGRIQKTWERKKMTKDTTMREIRYSRTG